MFILAMLDALDDRWAVATTGLDRVKALATDPVMKKMYGLTIYVWADALAHDGGDFGAAFEAPPSRRSTIPGRHALAPPRARHSPPSELPVRFAEWDRARAVMARGPLPRSSGIVSSGRARHVARGRASERLADLVRRAAAARGVLRVVGGAARLLPARRPRPADRHAADARVARLGVERRAISRCRSGSASRSARCGSS